MWLNLNSRGDVQRKLKNSLKTHKKCTFCLFLSLRQSVSQLYRGWATSMPSASTNPNYPWNFFKKKIENCGSWKSQFFVIFLSLPLITYPMLLGWTGSMIAMVLDFWEEALILSMISRGRASLILWLGTEKQIGILLESCIGI
jgi:hypothetical protein